MTRRQKPPESTEYRVGYARPPAHTRFQPGKSGNPTGKRRGTKSTATIVSEILNQKVALRTPSGAVRRVSGREALARKYIETAFKGDVRALMAILSLDETVNVAGGPPVDLEKLEAEDRAIIEQFYRKQKIGPSKT